MPTLEQRRFQHKGSKGQRIKGRQTMFSVLCPFDPLTLCVFLLLLSASAVGQASSSDSITYSRRVWRSVDGLPEDFAQALAQTPDGYLWIGTSGGLVRFDGTSFVVFNRENTLAFQDDSVY